MSQHLFKSMNGATLHEPTPEDMARDLALDMIDRIKERREIAKKKELDCEESEPWLTSDAEAYNTLEALMKGRHRQTVVRLLLQHFPELVAAMKVN